MDRFDELIELAAEKSLPPVHLWQPERVGEIDIHIDTRGDWYHEGEPILRQALVDLFATILRKDGADYFLVTPAEKLKIKIDDTPFIATEMEVRGAGAAADLLFTTNVGDIVMADADHPIEMRDEKPYVMVRDGLQARLTRSVFYRLVEEGAEEEGALVVYSQGARFPLGRVD